MTKRQTRAKQALWTVLKSSPAPLGAPDIIRRMHELGVTVNKTTVYRELDALVNNQEVITVELGDRITRYEPADRPHHHHLVCIRCERIEDVAITQDVHALERAIARKKKFAIVRHQLEFFGICHSCQSST